MKGPKKFGLSLEDKNKKLLDWFEKKHDVHSIKEVEVKASKETGISSIQIKDILQNLIDENLINSEKCGTLKLYWSFKGNKEINNNNLKISQIEKIKSKIKNLSESNEILINKIQDLKINRHTEISITSPEIIKEIRLYLSEIETDNKKTTNNEKKEVHSSNDSEESGDPEKSGDSDDSDNFDEDLCKQEYEPSLKLNRELLIAQLKKVEDEYILLEKNLKRINMKSPKNINEIKDKITFVNDMTEIITGKTNFFLFSYLKDSFLLTFSKR
ncbi:unnamed protein product [[Candida] boidinii]|uniref:Unnamed protein product n=1 Tax=Candida boidinii TaxID=5477 RepID=A0ACB5TFK0_CANBO|nr:unnamed protein product [[Candida] boidinii]